MAKKGNIYYPVNGDSLSVVNDGFEGNADVISAKQGWIIGNEVVSFPSLYRTDSSLVKFKGINAPSVVIMGDSISESDSRNPMPFQQDLATTYPALLGNTLYSKWGAGRKSHEFFLTADTNWDLVTEGLNLMTMKSTSTISDLPLYTDSNDLVPIQASGYITYMKSPDGGIFDVIRTGEGQTEQVISTGDCSGDRGDISTLAFEYNANSFYWIRPRSTTEYTYVSGFIAFANSLSQHAVYNISKGGRQLVQFSESALYKNLDTYTHDLAIMALGANDYGNNTDLTLYYERVEQFITHSKNNGKEVLILIQCGNSDTAVGGSKENLFIEMQQNIYTFADTYDCAVININTIFGGYDRANSNGLMTDTIHPNQEGHYVIADYISNVIFSVPAERYILPVTSKNIYWGVRDTKNVIFENHRSIGDGVTFQTLCGSGYSPFNPPQTMLALSGGNVPVTPILGQSYLDTDTDELVVCTGVSPTVWKRVSLA